jgi:hypothetical protein
MFLRKSVSRYKDKTYTNYMVVESVHTAKGPRQKVVCSLGDLSPRPANPSTAGTPSKRFSALSPFPPCTAWGMAASLFAA